MVDVGWSVINMHCAKAAVLQHQYCDGGASAQWRAMHMVRSGKGILWVPRRFPVVVGLIKDHQPYWVDQEGLRYKEGTCNCFG